MKGRSNSRSGVLGVYWCREREQWVAEVRVLVDGKVVRRRKRFSGNSNGKAAAAIWQRDTRRALQPS